MTTPTSLHMTSLAFDMLAEGMEAPIADENRAAAKFAREVGNIDAITECKTCGEPLRRDRLIYCERCCEEAPEPEYLEMDGPWEGGGA